MTAERRIVDGRHRWRAAVRLGLERVPCVEVAGEAALELILATLLARRHYTPGQRAYLIADLIEEAWKLAAFKRSKNASKNETNSVRFGDLQPLTQNCAPKPPYSGGALYAPEAEPGGAPRTVEDYARGLGVSVRLLQQARQVWERFRAHPEPFPWSDEALAARGLKPGTRLTLREYFEPAILADEAPLGLGRVLEGLGQKIIQAEREAEQGWRHRGRADVLAEPDRQMELFGEAWRTVRIRACEYWAHLPPERQAAVCEEMAAELAQMPDDYLAQLKALAHQELKRRHHDRAD
ncbi:MAG: ParB/RepB/Spo0J family partition protein [Chloroflexaceae bacterium]|nr:ParB/RepB/Spo0J family partition protein [Chloroflexaceae bacterium]